MSATTDPIGSEVPHGDDCALDDLERQSILRELDAILNSPYFQPSKRCQQFLSYVVRHRLEGNHERLKERMIGVDLFLRPIGYATGDDPVVRVQAGEVRRRLEQYYHATPNHSPVRIELHVGSYAPVFRWTRPALELQQTTPLQVASEHQEAIPRIGQGLESPQGESSSAAEVARSVAKHKRSMMVWVAIFIAVLVALSLIGSAIYRASVAPSAIQQFWSPALSSSEPVLICLAKPAVYLPSVRLYQRHSKNPEQFISQFERLIQKPDLQPDDKLVWGDMVEYPDYGLAAGDVYTAIRLSALIGQMGKKNQVRIGGQYSFEDLRNSPAVVIGAFNNRWTMQMTSNLHFAFAEEGDQSFIREEGPSGRGCGRKQILWHAGSRGVRFGSRVSSKGSPGSAAGLGAQKRADCLADNRYRRNLRPTSGRCYLRVVK
jgi:hypothetical protein